MGFGSFTLGYLLGQSFQNPQDIIETPGKCQADYDNDNDPELRAYGEECYWKAWDKAFKEGAIKRLRAGDNLFTLKGQPVYPDMSLEQIASFIESGEIVLIDYPKLNMVGLMWKNNERDESKELKYKALLSKHEELMRTEEFRIIS